MIQVSIRIADKNFFKSWELIFNKLVKTIDVLIAIFQRRIYRPGFCYTCWHQPHALKRNKYNHTKIRMIFYTRLRIPQLTEYMTETTVNTIYNNDAFKLRLYPAIKLSYMFWVFGDRFNERPCQPYFSSWMIKRFASVF